MSKATSNTKSTVFRYRKIFVALALVVTGVVASACGSSSPTTGSTTTTTKPGY